MSTDQTGLDGQAPQEPQETLEERTARLARMEREIEQEEQLLAAQEAALVAVDGRLSERQAAFVREYLVDFNGTQAAIRSGYSDPAITGSRLIRVPRIAKAIEAGRLSRESRVAMTREHVLQELALLANSSLENYVIDDDGQLRAAPGAPEGAMRAVQSIKRRVTTRVTKDGEEIKTVDVEFKLWDKPTPLKLMGKHTGLNLDRVEVSGPNGGPIVQRVVREVIDVQEGEQA